MSGSVAAGNSKTGSVDVDFSYNLGSQEQIAQSSTVGEAAPNANWCYQGACASGLNHSPHIDTRTEAQIAKDLDELPEKLAMITVSFNIAGWAAKGAVIGVKRLLKRNKKPTGTSSRKLGSTLESVDDVMENPQLLIGLDPKQLMARISNPDNWEVGQMRNTRSNNKGFTLRELNKRGSDYTDRYIQYHPGSRRHYGGAPYWKVSSGKGGIVRFPVNGD